ncbi:hypothetical protein [Ectopseudomonas toyotomiensis]|uniref:hypothetical protein n=1 Tax=Ectopseudomonas toyotomiensis TaxID=554344 RepID=UPI003D0F2764
MSLVLVSDEQEAWDCFANSALKAVLNSRPINGDEAAAIAAKIADALIEERRKRKKPTTASSSPLRV